VHHFYDFGDGRGTRVTLKNSERSQRRSTGSPTRLRAPVSPKNLRACLCACVPTPNCLRQLHQPACRRSLPSIPCPCTLPQKTSGFTRYGKREAICAEERLGKCLLQKRLRSNRLKCLAAIRLLRECCFSVAMAVS
jgi:hypothetical protein